MDNVLALKDSGYGSGKAMRVEFHERCPSQRASESFLPASSCEELVKTKGKPISNEENPDAEKLILNKL